LYVLLVPLVYLQDRLYVPRAEAQAAASEQQGSDMDDGEEDEEFEEDEDIDAVAGSQWFAQQGLDDGLPEQTLAADELQQVQSGAQQRQQQQEGSESQSSSQHSSLHAAASHDQSRGGGDGGGGSDSGSSTVSCAEAAVGSAAILGEGSRRVLRRDWGATKV
jgi:hypothetical protein